VAPDDASVARRTIELGVVAATVGRVSADAVAELRRLMEAGADTAFREHFVGLAGSASLLASYRRLLGTDAAEAHRQRALVEAYEAGDVERARAAVG
jgi:hypothetical protein